MKKFCLSACIIMSCAVPSLALAAAITNMDTRPRQIILREGDGPRTLEIQPGETYRVSGFLNITYHGYDMRIDSGDEYAIWSDGALGPQRRAANNNRGQ